ncbi:uncharacterized protein LOC135138046 isoform X2 [Zophobas morio]|uniref:uncharacterized protein LOC135138046 isoform X2 n=1 Tax=Zophobas morio TaxID=2755281 RepID=UPI003082B5D2
MACARQSLLAELHDLVNQIGDSCGSSSDPCSCCTPDPPCAPCCPPCNFPYAQVIISCPPPVLAPIYPEPVKPLGLFCPKTETPLMTLQEREDSRYDSFYNNYNIDWHSESPRYANKYIRPECTPDKQKGQTVDGKSPCCDCLPCEPCLDVGCPTGFKPCTMRLTPPPCCHPCGVWCAEIQPCPPKPKKCLHYKIGAALETKPCS